MTNSSTPHPTLLSIVAPFYNEQDNIAPFFERIYALVNKKNPKYIIEVIAVNDGSSDTTLPMLIEMSNRYPRVCVIDLSRNFGKEAALSAGLNHVNGQVVVTIDTDLQHPPEKILEMTHLWEGGYEVILAKRSSRETDHFIQRSSANAFYRLHNMISDIEIPADVGDFRMMDISVVRELNRLQESRRFMKGLFAWVGFKTITIEYEVEPRLSGKSSFNTWQLWNFALEGITSFSSAPLRVWSYVGALISGFSFTYAMYLIVKTLMYGSDAPGFASIMVTVLFIGGVQLIGIGVLGEYIGRTYNEVKNRPVYIVRRLYRSND